MYRLYVSARSWGDLKGILSAVKNHADSWSTDRRGFDADSRHRLVVELGGLEPLTS
jgi:hypothetical protein